MAIIPPVAHARDACASLVAIGEVIPLLLLVAIYGIAAILQSTDLIAAVNVIGSCGLISIMLYGCRRQLRATPLAIWTPMVWFRVATAAYFGFGQLVPYIVNGESLAELREIYYFGDAEILKLNTIIVLGVICVMTGASATKIKPRTASVARASSGDRILFLASLFIIPGAIVRYWVVLPAAIGDLGTIPGSVLTLSKLYSAGLLLLLLAGLRRRGVTLVIAIGLAAIEMAVWTLMFNKSEVLLTLVFGMLAVWIYSPRYEKLAIVVLATIAIYALLVPLVEYGRSEIIRQHGSQYAVAPLTERLTIVRAYFSLGQGWQEQTGDGVQHSLMRLSYVNVAGRVVAWRDEGLPGDSLSNALIVVIPRFLWPDKPLISEVGTNLYSAITGQTGTSVAAGLFAEAYWNLGWLGLPLVLCPFGIFLRVLSGFALSVMTQERWVFLPAVLGGISVAVRVDGAIVIDAVGGGVIVLLAYLLLFVAGRFFFASSGPAAAAPLILREDSRVCSTQLRRDT